MVALARFFDAFRAEMASRGRSVPAIPPATIAAGQVQGAQNNGHATTPLIAAGSDQRWLRFSKRLAAALEQDGRALRRQHVRLQVETAIYGPEGAGVVLNAAVVLVRNGVHEAAIAGLHVTGLPERRDERPLAGLSGDLTGAADAWLRNKPRLGVLPVFTYP